MLSKKYMQCLCIASLLLQLGGCMNNEVKPNDPKYAPVPPAQLVKPPNNSGSIYQVGFERRLFEDIRAYRVGDILTVTLIENTNANKNANTSLTKNTNVNPGTPKVAGVNPTLNAPDVPLVGSTAILPLESRIDAQNKFTATSNSKQNNTITGNITVTVAEVLPNENLVIRGEKWVGINRGQEYIRLSGIVRPQDISATNTVDSIRVADVRIEYSGTGDVAESNSMGWLARFFNSAKWLF